MSGLTANSASNGGFNSVQQHKQQQRLQQTQPLNLNFFQAHPTQAPNAANANQAANDNGSLSGFNLSGSQSPANNNNAGGVGAQSSSILNQT